MAKSKKLELGDDILRTI